MWIVVSSNVEVNQYEKPIAYLPSIASGCLRGLTCLVAGCEQKEFATNELGKRAKAGDADAQSRAFEWIDRSESATIILIGHLASYSQF
jgi:hypothetical protein